MGNYATQPDFATQAVNIAPSDIFDETTYLDGSALYVGVGGDINVIMRGINGEMGNLVKFRNVPDGAFLPMIVDYVAATGTTASSILSIH